MICPASNHSCSVVNLAVMIVFEYLLTIESAYAMASNRVFMDLSVIGCPSNIPSPYHRRAFIFATDTLSVRCTRIGITSLYVKRRKSLDVIVASVFDDLIDFSAKLLI